LPVLQIRARSSWLWRLAAVVAVSTQIVTSICGVLLLCFWVWATLTGYELPAAHALSDL
jgi:hypothetical protein